MRREPGHVVGIRVREQEGVDVEPALVVAGEAPLEILGNVVGVVLGIVGGGADVDVDEDRLPS
ncbi:MULTISPECIES: hypothetical protein [unclassified Mesorhizobium]|uniref:hypothetical protein n=1 Tax=unclassified Mesorhizobium TaxID=325217 RepID=UPI00167937AE|nr:MULTISPECIES: hypothetical protein [unclassified Mesorhizobium]